MKKLSSMILLALALCCWGCAPEVTKPVRLNTLEAQDILNDSKLCEINKAIATFDAKGALKISSTGSDWKCPFKTKNLVLKPNTAYTLLLDYQVEQNQGIDCYLHVLVRNMTRRAPDLLLANQYAQTPTSMKLSFETGDDTSGYEISINTPRKMNAIVTKLQLCEGAAEDFYPATKDAPRYTGDLGKLPTGAKEFDVELPNNPKGAVVNAKDFGLSESCADPQEAINKAIEHCKKIGASKLVIDKGTYCINKDGSILFDNVKDLTFDANGSSFIYCKNEGTNLVVSNCERVKFCNFNMDWDWEKDPLGSIVEIVAVDKEKKYIDIKFIDYKRFPRRDLRIAVMSGYDPVRKAVGLEDLHSLHFETFRGRSRPTTEWLSDNVLRISPSKDHSMLNIANAKVGALHRIQHSYYEMGGVNLRSNRHLTMENVNIYSCSGCSFVISGTQKYWQLLNVNVISPKGLPLRAITTTADHLHISESCGFGKLVGCEFERGADDCINMHDCSGFAQAADENTVRTRNVTRIYNYSVGDLIELRNGDFSPSGFKSKIKSIKTIDGKKGIHEIAFEDKIPEQKFDGFILFNWKYDTRNMILRDCYFHDNKARAVLVLCRDVTIENCRFEHNEIGAIHIETGYTFNVWSEGYGVDNVVFRNCVFDSVNPTNRKIVGKAMDVYMGVYMKSDPTTEHTRYPILSNILFDGNTFKNSFGLVALVTSTGNLTWINNTYINETPRINKFKYRGDIYVSHSQNTRIVNNTYIASPLVPQPGVLVDSDTVENILVAGNRIVEKQ